MKTPKTKKEMVEYLTGHFRYDTMNSWNRATSYARNVKLHRLTFADNATRNRAYDLLQTEEAFDGVKQIMAEFDERHGYEYQIGFNGRSGGYLVMYQGGSKSSEYKRQCHDCGQRNYQADSVKCGRCGSDNMHDYHGTETFTYPGKGMDMDEDFSEWDTESLRSRVKLVMDFDRTCDACEKAFVQFCVNHKAEERTISVPKQITIAVPA